MAEGEDHSTDEDIALALAKASGPQRAEADQLIDLLSDISGHPPVVWSGRMIGFGSYDYRYATGHSGTSAEIAFATGSARHTFYLVEGFAERWPDLLERLGPHRLGSSCLHTTRLSTVNPAVLRDLLERSLADRRANT